MHLPATGDEGFKDRRYYFAEPLAERHGITSVLLLVPFYGMRRCASQDNPALQQVQNFAEQVLGAVIESNAIIQWLVCTMGHRGKIGFTGVSFGGSMAALGSIFCNVPHVSVPYIPANGPADAYVLGSLSKTVDWKLFDEGKKSVFDLLRFMDIGDCAVMIRENFSQVINWGKQPKRVYIQASGRHDRYIPIERGDKLYSHMKELPNIQYSEYIVLKGGHVTAFICHREIYLSMISRALELLEV